MLTLIPGPVRRLVLDGLGRLLHHLLGLAEEVRCGLIDAVSRAVSESVEGVLHSVIRSRSAHGPSFNRPVRMESTDRTEWSEPDDRSHNPPTHNRSFRDSREFPDDADEANPFDPDRDSQPIYEDSSEDPNRPSSPSFLRAPWRLAVATGLSGLATWLSTSGLTAFATASSILAGAILFFPG